MSEVYVFNSEKLVTIVTPEMTPDWRVFTLPVVCVDFDEGRWCVLRYHQYLAADGSWSWRNMSDEDWYAAHVFSHDEAVALAQKYAPTVNVNGMTAQRVADRFHAERELGGG